MNVLTAHQNEVMTRVLAEECTRREHVVVSLSGAHAYGFPSPDSDLDLKAVHIESAEAFLGFPTAPRGAERLEVIDGVEIDYSSNELGAVLQGVLKGNGTYLERFLSGFVAKVGTGFEELVPLVQASLSRKLSRHYAGFATQQKLEWERTGKTSAKKLLYVVRTVLTGTHALRTGRIVTDLNELVDAYGFSDARELIEQKRRGELAELPTSLSEEWANRIPSLFELFRSATANSVLPEEPTNAEELESWLVRMRLRMLKR